MLGALPPDEDLLSPATGGAPAETGHEVQLARYTPGEPGADPDGGSAPDPGASDPREVVPAPSGPPAGGTLELQHVLASVRESYPLLEVALREREVARGKELAAWGEFDLTFKAYGLTEPLGYYKPTRSLAVLSQPMYAGGTVYGAYRIGDGTFQPWYQERETDEGGEFSVGVEFPLLKDRAIDKRRSELTVATLAREAVEPAVQAQLLGFVRAATQAYWAWVAAGQALEAQRALLQLALQRVQQIEDRVQAGDLERIAQLNNGQLIAARETKVIEAERKLQEAAIKLSLFLRDPLGEPILPQAAQLPPGFPAHSPPHPEQAQRETAVALERRPEFAELDLLAQQVRVELSQAENMLLPKLNAVLDASKDVGFPASPKRDKTPLELETGLVGELPLQRREAWGKINAARGKLAQLRAKREYLANKVAAEVQDTVSALSAAAGRIDRARASLELATQTLKLGQVAFRAGDIDLIALNIYEQAVTDAQLVLIAAQADYFAAEADYRAAVAEDPFAE